VPFATFRRSPPHVGAPEMGLSPRPAAPKRCDFRAWSLLVVARRVRARRATPGAVLSVPAVPDDVRNVRQSERREGDTKDTARTPRTPRAGCSRGAAARRPRLFHSLARLRVLFLACARVWLPLWGSGRRRWRVSPPACRPRPSTRLCCGGQITRRDLVVSWCARRRSRRATQRVCRAAVVLFSADLDRSRAALCRRTAWTTAAAPATH
jgi:hypothetical protein